MTPRSPFADPSVVPPRPWPALTHASPFVDDVAHFDEPDNIEHELPRSRPQVTIGPFPTPLVLEFDPTDKLQRCVDAIATKEKLANEPTLAEQRYLERAPSLGAIVVDLTGAPAKPSFATTANVDATFYVGSLLKIVPLYAAHELRVRVQRIVDNARLGGLDVSKRGWHTPLLAAIKASWRSEVQRDFEFAGLDKSFPDLATMFDFAPNAVAGEEVQFKRSGAPGPQMHARLEAVGEYKRPTADMAFDEWLTLMIGWSSDPAADMVIATLGFSYLNGLLRAAGFSRKLDPKGIWISGGYGRHEWKTGHDLMALSRQGTTHYKPKTNFAASAREVARLLALAATGRLFGSASPGPQACRDMLTRMDKMPGAGTTSFARDAIEARGGTVDAVSSKLGIGIASPGKIKGYHDAAVIERKRPSGLTVRYVVVGLGAGDGQLATDPPPWQALFRLFFELDRCVEAQHP